MQEIIIDLTKLEQPAEPLKFMTDVGLNKEEGLDIINKLKEVLEANPNLLALSAPQIGVNKRIFCIKFDDTIKTFINPIITKKSKYEIAPETFGSMPNKEILIARPTDITVVYYTNEFKYEENKLLGAAAKLFDQQAQVLDGVLPNELGLVSDIETDGSLANLNSEEINELLEIYKKFISYKLQAVKSEIDSDEVVAKQYKQLKVTEDVINGRTELVANTPLPPELNRAQRRALKKMSKKGGKKK